MGAREELDALSASLDGLAASTSAYARAALAQWLASNPSAPRAERASFAAGLLMEVSGAFGAQAAEAAMDFLAALSVEPGDASPSVAAAYAARKGAWIASLDDAAALDAAGDTAASYVRRDAFEASARACDRAGVRWARVPTGSETCAFCFMLASRGYAYTSEHAARGGMGMHAHCDCKVVPETAGKIEGYDPDGLYRRWRMCADAVAADPDATGQDSLRAIMREVERRDWEWLWTGKVPEIDYSLQPRESFGVFRTPGYYSRENLVLEEGKSEPNEWRDLFVHDCLSKNGIRVKARPNIAVDREGNPLQGVSSPDLEISGVMWEVKSPRDPEGESEPMNRFEFIERALKASKKNFKNPYDYENHCGMGDMTDRRRVVLNLKYRSEGIEYSEMEEEVEKAFAKSKVVELIVVDADGAIHRYKK